MTSAGRRLDRERRTMARMVEIYCADHHAAAGTTPCDACGDFLGYAARRLHKCPYGDDKPTCANCPIHCYKTARREQVREIMRYAGPRMLLHHPLLAVAHKLDGLRTAVHPNRLTREQRRNL